MKHINRISEAQNHRCCYCGHTVVRYRPGTAAMPRNTATRDHIIPRCHGGTYGNNIVIACVQCNNLRGDMEAYAFYNLMQKWFKRNPLWQSQWYALKKETLQFLFREALATHERQLKGLAVRNKEYAFRHQQLLHTHGHLLRA